MTGLLVILLMPSDIIILFTVGVNLVHNNAGLLAAFSFIAATVLVAALPLLFHLVFHRRAQQFMPKVPDWMNTHSWLVNIIVCVVFIVPILASESSSITLHGVRASRQAT
jgi:threonine/homoserine/homoserine lactone efflux protein